MNPLDLQRELETLLDQSSLPEMITELAAICYAKADHIRTNWQDEQLARQWAKAADKLSHVVVSGPILWHWPVSKELDKGRSVAF
jgi:hypothetical protein